MPLGLWKSRRGIDREEAHFFRQEMLDLRTETRDLREEARDLRADYDRDVSEARLFNRELLIRMEKTYGSLGSTLEFMGEELLALRQEVHELKDAVEAQTDAILRLVDRFEDADGRPPV